jgi:hypothetical protein
MQAKKKLTLGPVSSLGFFTGMHQVADVMIQSQHTHPLPEKRHRHSEDFGIDHSAILAQTLADLNGLIINDKFCMVRTGKLKLNHWRRPLQLREDREKEYSAHRRRKCRGNEEKIVENRTNGAGAPGRRKAVGSGLSVGAEDCTISESQSHTGSSPDGGRPCE